MRTISYTHLKNVLCPIRQYLSLTNTLQPNNKQHSILGVVIHDIYTRAIKEGNFDFVNNIHTYNKLSSYDDDIIHFVYKNINKHLHSSFLKSIPDGCILETTINTVLNNIELLNSTIKFYIKPDIYFIKNNTCTIIEIKTSSSFRYDKIQLLFYAWCLSVKNPEINKFVLKVYNTYHNKYIFDDTIGIVHIHELISLHINSVNNAYELLDIRNIQEVSCKIKHLINTKSTLLQQLFCHISIEQCDTCFAQIICPALLQDIISAFTDKNSNETSSNILSHFSSILSANSVRKIVIQ